MFWGILCLCLTAILFALALVGARDPKKPKWFENFQWIWATCIAGLGFFGAILILLELRRLQAVTAVESVGGLAVIGVTIVFLKIIAPKKRLKKYAELGRS